MNYSLAPEAEAELAEAAIYYAESISKAMADRFLAMFESKAILLTRFPGSERRP